jgi:hypothetical protein
VLRSAVEFCYSYGWKDLNCCAETLVDFYICGSLSNSGFLPICIFSLEIWNLNKFVKLFMDLFEFGQGRYPPFGNVTKFCGMSPTNLLIFSSPRSYWRSTATQLLFSVVIWRILFSRVRVLSFIPWHSHYQADLVGRENDKERGQVDVESVIRLDLMEKLCRKLQLILDNCSVAIGIFWTCGEWGCGCGFGCGWRLCLTAWMYNIVF